jgi:hypothetical protein
VLLRRERIVQEPVRTDEWALLRRMLAEAIIVQDQADELLARFREERPDPATVAPACGRIRCRFAQMRLDLASFTDPEVRRYCARLRPIFDHHALLLDTSIGLLAGSARVEALAERLNDIDGLGPQARRLEALRLEVLAIASRIARARAVQAAVSDEIRRHGGSE